MDDAISRVRASRGALERLGARLPGFSGYLERELRREMDQLLRLELAAGLDRARDALLAALARVAPQDAAVARLAALEKSLDRLANRLRHAGAGYAGAFDAAKVRQAELEALYHFDEGLMARVDETAATAARAAGEPGAVPALETAVAMLDAELAGRDAVVRSAFGAYRQEVR
jgi:hypothetical protein